jgi:hypothetical protein
VGGVDSFQNSIHGLSIPSRSTHAFLRLSAFRGDIALVRHSHSLPTPPAVALHEPPHLDPVAPPQDLVRPRRRPAEALRHRYEAHCQPDLHPQQPYTRYSNRDTATGSRAGAHEGRVPAVFFTPEPAFTVKQPLARLPCARRQLQADLPSAVIVIKPQTVATEHNRRDTYLYQRKDRLQTRLPSPAPSAPRLWHSYPTDRRITSATLQVLPQAEIREYKTPQARCIRTVRRLREVQPRSCAHTLQLPASRPCCETGGCCRE